MNFFFSVIYIDNNTFAKHTNIFFHLGEIGARRGKIERVYGIRMKPGLKAGRGCVLMCILYVRACVAYMKLTLPILELRCVV